MAHIATPVAGVVTTSTATPTFAVLSTVPVGRTLVGAVVMNTSGSTPTVTVTDTKGNTYTTHNVTVAASTNITAVFSARITTQLTTSDTLTVSVTDGTHIRWAITVEEFDDILVSPFDKVASATGTGTAMSSGATTATTNNNELVFGAFGFGNPAGKAITPGSGFTGGTIVGTAVGTSDRGVYAQWKYVVSTGVQTSSATINSSTTWAAVVATFKSVTVANQAPTANAGPDQAVAANQLVKLNGTGSTDSDGTIASYAWTQTAGPTVTLNNDNTSQPTFKAPLVTGGTSLTFQLTATDDAGATSTDSVTITVSQPVGHVATPVAGVASTTNTASFTIGSTVPAGHTLVGALVSTDPIGSTPSATVTDSKGNTYTVHATVAGLNTATTVVFSCELTTALTTSDTITVSMTGATYTRWAISVEQFDNLTSPARDQLATNMGTGTAMDSGTTATTTSTHELVFGAFGFGSIAGKTVTAGSGYTASTPQGTAIGTSDRSVFAEWKYVNSAGTQNAQATLNSSTTWTAAIVTFPSQTVANQAPIANAGPDQTVAAQQLVTLGGVSTDSDGSIVEYSWTQLSGPAVTLSDTEAANPTFIAPTIRTGTTLSFGLVVIDNASDESTQDTVTITVNAPVGHVSTPIKEAKEVASLKTVSYAVTQTVAPGHVVIGTLLMENPAGSAAPDLVITDSKGNGYTIHAISSSSGTCHTVVFTARLSRGLTTSDTLTITDNARTHIRWILCVEVFDNLLTPGVPLDRIATSADRNTAITSGATVSLSVPDELVFASFGYGMASSAQTFTAGSTYTTSGQVASTTGSTDRGLSTMWKFVNASTAVNPDATLSATANYAGITTTFKAYSITGNTSPVADAGIDQAVTINALVTLDGSASSDVDGTVTGYIWRQISGPAVTLSSTSVAKPTFTSPGSNTTLVFGLKATDNQGGQSAEDTVTILVGSHSGYVSEVIAGTKAVGGTSITLPFLKTIPTGHTLLIGVAVETSKGAATFTATDTKGNTYTLDAVSNNGGTIANGILSCFVTGALTTADSITISSGAISHNRWAVAGSEFDNIVQNGKDVAAIAANRSTFLDTGTTPLSANQYEVIFASFGFSRNNSQTFSPAGSYVLAGQVNVAPGSSDRAVANAYTYFSSATNYRATGYIQAIAMWSGAVVSYRATSLGNLAPIANAGSAQTVQPFSTVTLNGSNSADPDGVVTEYTWQQLTGPAVTLSSTTVAQPTFTAPGVDGGTTLTFSLMVKDNSNDLSTVSTVTITVLSAASFVAKGGAWVASQPYTLKGGSWQ